MIRSTDTCTQSSVRPKVLHLLADVLPGGMETLLLNLLRSQQRSDSCENTVAVLHRADEDGSLRHDIEFVSDFHDLDCESFFSLPFVKKFRVLLEQLQPDVVHCWSYDSGVVAGAIARFGYNIKVTWAIHSMDLPSRAEYSTFRFNTMKSVVALASRFVPHTVISCSDMASDAHVNFGFPRDRCLTIDNGIDTDRYNISPDARMDVRAQLGISVAATVIGYVGRCHPVKRIEDFFHTAAILMGQLSDVQFIAVGFSLESLYPAARKAYELLPDPSRMHLLGSQPDTAEYFQAIDLTVLTSESEALPMVLMESLACGVPCVSTDVGSASRVIGKMGKCVPAKNPALFAAAVLEVLDSKVRAEDARRHCLNHFSIGVAAQRYSGRFEKLTGKSSIATVKTQKKVKVIHLVNDVGYGGAQVLLKRLAIGLKADGFEQTVVSVLPLEKIGKLAPEFEKAGIPVRSLEIDGPINGLRGLLKFGAMVRELKPDLVQTWMFHSALIGELSKLFAFRKMETLWSIHHTYLGKESSKWGTRVIHRLLAWISPALPASIVYCSKAGLDLHHDCGFDEQKSELIFNGTDTEIYRPNRDAKADLRNELGIPQDAPLIGMAGRYHPQKDFANLLRAFAMVQKAVPNAHLLACGPEVTRDTQALAELADACPFSDQVHLIGPRRDMVNIYPALTIGALSSCEGEAFPLVLGEAMACEVPCVATDVGDSALIIGDTGRIVPPRDSHALATELILMLKLSQQTYRDLAKSARIRVQQKFALDTYVHAHASLYRRLLGLRSTRKKRREKQQALASIPKVNVKETAA